MPPMVVTELVSHAEMSALNDVVLSRIDHVSCVLEQLVLPTNEREDDQERWVRHRASAGTLPFGVAAEEDLRGDHLMRGRGRKREEETASG